MMHDRLEKKINNVVTDIISKMVFSSRYIEICFNNNKHFIFILEQDTLWDQILFLGLIVS